MKEIEYQRISNESFPQIEIPIVIPKNIAPIERSEKKKAVKNMHTRFQVNDVK